MTPTTPTHWTRLPVSAGTSRSLDFWTVFEIYAALMERRNLFQGYFPQTAFVWGGGRVGTNTADATYDTNGFLTSVTIYPEPKQVGKKPDPPGADDPAPVAFAWNAWTGFRFLDIPIPLDVVIEPIPPLASNGVLDPRTIIRTGPRDVPGVDPDHPPAPSNVLHLDPVWTYGVNLAGAHVNLVHRLDLPRFGPWWQDRWPTVPSATMAFTGTTTVSGNTVTQTGANWASNTWSGKTVYVWDATGNRTLSTGVSGNTADTLAATLATNLSAGSTFAIGDADLFWRLPNKTWYPGWKWYDAHTEEAQLSHDADGEPVATSFPDQQVTWTVFDPLLGSRPETHQVFEADLIVPFDLEGLTILDPNTPDRFYSAYLYRTIHGLQLAIEGMAGGWVPHLDLNGNTVDYDGSTGIPNYSWATMCKTVGIGVSGTAGVPSSGIVTITAPTGCQELHWTLLGLNGEPNSAGVANVSGGVVTFTFAPFVSAGDHCNAPNLGDAGKTLVWTTSWTRVVEREIRYAYAANWFQAAFYVTGAGEAAVDPDPGDDSTAGIWFARPASAASLEYQVRGDHGAGEALVVGGRYRYAGDRANESNPGGSVSDSDAAWRCKQGDWTLNPAQRATMRGTVAAGGRGWLDSGQRGWWWWGTACTHTGGASATYTGTTITDPAKAGSDFWDAATGRMNGFTVEILQPGVSGGDPGSLDGRRALITSTVKATGQIGFAAMAGLSNSYTSALGTDTFAGGTVYRIREPRYRLNFWQGRLLRLTDPTGGTHDLTIRGNDDGFLFWDPASSVEPGTGGAGWSWEIRQFEPGQTLVYQGLSGGVPQWAYPPASEGDPFTINPDRVPRYGRVRKWDTPIPENLNEMMRAISAMRWIKWGVSWLPSPTLQPDDFRTNVYSSGEPIPAAGLGYDGPGGWTVPASTAAFVPNVQTTANAMWDSFVSTGFLPMGPENGPPTASSASSFYKDGTSDAGEWQAEGGLYRKYSWPWVQGIPNGWARRRFACTAEIYALATCPESYVGSVNCADTSGNTVYHFDNTYTFDNFGDAPLEKDKWKRIGSIGGTDIDRVGPQVGSPSKPAWAGDSSPPTPTVPPGQTSPPYQEHNRTSRWRGYYVVGQVAILKYDSALGFIG